MADREDLVYMAKLAEQAERYDGIYSFTIHVNDSIKICRLSCITSSRII